jgi:hypothetical protein
MGWIELLGVGASNVTLYQPLMIADYGALMQ